MLEAAAQRSGCSRTGPPAVSGNLLQRIISPTSGFKGRASEREGERECIYEADDKGIKFSFKALVQACSQRFEEAADMQQICFTRKLPAAVVTNLVYTSIICSVLVLESPVKSI